MREPVWLQKSVVIALHEMLLVEHGGPPGMISGQPSPHHEVKVLTVS